MSLVLLRHLRPGRVTAISATYRVLAGFHHELTLDALEYDVLHPVLFLDGGHVLNGYDFAEANIQRGREPEAGIDRVLTARCMTPFQWGRMLTTDLHDQIAFHRPSLVVASSWNTQFDKDDLVDWEQEDYVRSTLAMMRRIARIHAIPIAITLDLARWSRSHPAAARILIESGINVLRLDWRRGWRLETASGEVLVEPPALLGTLDHFVPKPAAVKPLTLQQEARRA